MAKTGGFMAMVVDLMVGDEDGARRRNEETNGAVEAGGDEGVDEWLRQRGARVWQGSGQRGDLYGKLGSRLGPC